MVTSQVDDFNKTGHRVGGGEGVCGGGTTTKILLENTGQIIYTLFQQRLCSS